MKMLHRLNQNGMNGRFDSQNDISRPKKVLSEIVGHRCRDVGLSPSGKPVDAVTSDIDLSIIQEKNQRIRQFVLPELQLLYNQIAGTNFMVAYADTSGIVLDAYLDEEFKRSDAGKAVIPGSIWTEDNRGTNALGLASTQWQTSNCCRKRSFL
ncbi:MAG: hypothetical protein ACJ0GC_08775 [Amylibacter sp.]